MYVYMYIHIYQALHCFSLREKLINLIEVFYLNHKLPQPNYLHFTQEGFSHFLSPFAFPVTLVKLDGGQKLILRLSVSPEPTNRMTQPELEPASWPHHGFLQPVCHSMSGRVGAMETP